MKKIIVLITAVTVTLAISCSRKSKPQSSTVADNKSATTYSAAISSVIQAKCSPCHIPSAGGNKEALDTYDAAKGHIDDIIRRIEMNPGERGYMPFKRDKLSSEEIALFKKWREDGLVK